MSTLPQHPLFDQFQPTSLEPQQKSKKKSKPSIDDQDQKPLKKRSQKRQKKFATETSPSAQSESSIGLLTHKESESPLPIVEETSADEMPSLQTDEYEVECILAKAYMPQYGEHFYQVKWKGFAELTWEPAANLSHLKKMIKAFNEELLNTLKAQKAMTEKKVVPENKLKRLKKQSSCDGGQQSNQIDSEDLKQYPKKKRARKSKCGKQQSSEEESNEVESIPQTDVVVIDEDCESQVSSKPMIEENQSQNPEQNEELIQNIIYPPALKNYIPGQQGQKVPQQVRLNSKQNQGKILEKVVNSYDQCFKTDEQFLLQCSSQQQQIETSPKQVSNYQSIKLNNHLNPNHFFFAPALASCSFLNARACSRNKAVLSSKSIAFFSIESIFSPFSCNLTAFQFIIYYYSVRSSQISPGLF